MKYCCDEFEKYVGNNYDNEGIEVSPNGEFYVVDEEDHLIFEIFYCPFCGKRLK